MSLAYPGYQGDEGGAKLISFTGRADSVEFLAPLPDRFGAPALVWYRIGVGNDGGLHMAWRLDRGEESETILMTGLGSASFSYFGGDGAGHERRWSNAWVGQTQLPELVRLHLARDDGEAAAWPDLVVAPLLSASIECTFDQTDGKCRG